jgi:hypothetical protein
VDRRGRGHLDVVGAANVDGDRLGAGEVLEQVTVPE